MHGYTTVVMYIPCIYVNRNTMYIHGYTTYILGRYTWYILGYTMYIHDVGYTWYIHGYTTYISCILVRTAYAWDIHGIYQAYTENRGQMSATGIMIA